MTLLTFLALSLTTTAPDVRVDTLDGKSRQGALVALSAEAATVRTADGEVTISTQDLLSIRSAENPDSDQSGSRQIRLRDGSQLRFREISTSGREMQISGDAYGKLTIPVAAVASIRFASGDSEIEKSWAALLERDQRKDRLVIRRDNALDHLEGIIGDIDEKTVRFLLDTDPIPVPIERIFGIVYLPREVPAGQTACRVHLPGDDVLAARSVTLDDGELVVRPAAGGEVRIAAAKVTQLDFSFGKVQYLSQMEPRDVRYTPFFDIVLYEMRRDTNLDGGPLRLRDRTYARGLAMHSRTQARWRLGGEYRRLQAVMGIDPRSNGAGDVQVTIRGDGRSLLQTDVRGTDPPRELDLDVSGVRDLEILVDFGGDLDIWDHLLLGDAKVTK